MAQGAHWDIGPLLRRWPIRPGGFSARLAYGEDDRPFLVARVAMGLLQMELDGRPDGQTFRGKPTCLDWIEAQEDEEAVEAGDWLELQRELLQFHQRHAALMHVARKTRARGDRLLAQSLFARAARDAFHMLGIACVVAAAGLEEELLEPIGQDLPGLTADHALAMCEYALTLGDPESAIDMCCGGQKAIKELYAAEGLARQARQDPAYRALRRRERRLRRRFAIEQTTQEQLEAAVRAEDYERAIVLRDRLRQRRARLEDAP